MFQKYFMGDLLFENPEENHVTGENFELQNLFKMKDEWVDSLVLTNVLISQLTLTE